MGSIIGSINIINLLSKLIIEIASIKKAINSKIKNKDNRYKKIINSRISNKTNKYKKTINKKTNNKNNNYKNIIIRFNNYLL